MELEHCMMEDTRKHKQIIKFFNKSYRPIEVDVLIFMFVQDKDSYLLPNLYHKQIKRFLCLWVT